ncbi:hypothetical protein D8682_25205 [Buttiauxella sp. 3AFRM03]|uniref:hypothetical protein n=1 Tax=Buttiauxella sp. 3AFRM03 TaxID=2479367 RepID=UPI000EF7E395|nr:hypothetical protein [Buttiauxella sp. 3AFRM03]AYN29983.1 hypothetical protein D8682_25205 [Buttiauxella sp. 3AFRM03]
MSILSVMLIITAAVASFLAARYVVYHVLVWLKPSKTLKLTYLDHEGVKHTRETSLDDKDARALVSILNEIRRDADLKQDA